MNINIYVYINANQLLKKGFKGEMGYFKISPLWDSNEGYISECVLSPFIQLEKWVALSKAPVFGWHRRSL